APCLDDDQDPEDNHQPREPHEGRRSVWKCPQPSTTNCVGSTACLMGFACIVATPSTSARRRAGSPTRRLAYPGPAAFPRAVCFHLDGDALRTTSALRHRAG